MKWLLLRQKLLELLELGNLQGERVSSTLSSCFRVKGRASNRASSPLRSRQSLHVPCCPGPSHAAALACLREEVQPLGVAPPRLHCLARLARARSPPPPPFLSAPSPTALLPTRQMPPSRRADSAGRRRRLLHPPPQLFCPDAPSLRQEACWPGAGPESRQGTLRELLLLLPMKDVVPEGRLEELVEQAVGAQMDGCLYHNALGRARPESLMRNYAAGPEQLPSRQADMKDGHGDEVWSVEWSHDGGRLATASKNGGAAVWELALGREGPRLRLQHVLKGHTGAPAICHSSIHSPCVVALPPPVSSELSEGSLSK